MVRKAPLPPPQQQPQPPPPPQSGESPPNPPPKKKKGRPSLLDLQRRALNQQQQQQQKTKQENPVEPPNSSAPLRRSTRRNPLPTQTEDDDDDEHRGRRREKKLKLVLENGSSDRPSDAQKTERPNSTSHSKVMGGGTPQGEPSDSGPTTPLPDKKTLLLILDRLQKKDKYGVYSEPVDPEELPDYHEIIEHPMDFSTVRKKLLDGVYANLEQFENDVYLISSNAMEYNASDTIYYRQARAIGELAKKSFENLRQGNEENEPEPEVKVARRGRPPGKNSAKKAVGRPPAESTVIDSVDASPVNTTYKPPWFGSPSDNMRKGSLSNMMGFMTSYLAPQVPKSSENRFQVADHNRFGRNEDSSGFMQRGLSTRFGKKVLISEDSRRSTYLQPLPSTSEAENPILSTFRGEKKQLLPIGIFIEHAYARSLSRFAANLGSAGWEIASKRIERALPPGTPFGRGWVGENEMPHLNQHQTLVSSTHPNEQSVALVNPAPSSNEATSKQPDYQPGDSSSSHIPPNSSQGSSSISTPHSNSLLQKDISQTQKNLQVPPLQKMNGFSRFYVDLSQGNAMAIQSSTTGDFHREVPMTHAQLLDIVSRTSNVGLPPQVATQFEAEKAKLGHIGYATNSKPPFHPSSDSHLTSIINTEMSTSGDHVSHPARPHTELERVNFSNSGTSNFTGRFVHPLTSVNSSSMVCGNPAYPGPKDHGFSLHSAVGDHSSAEPSAPEDSSMENPHSMGAAQKNTEPSHEKIAKAGKNMLHVKQDQDKEDPCSSDVPQFESSNPLPDAVQQSFQEPSVQFPKSDSICPDLNSCVSDDRLLANSRNSCRIPEV